MQISLITAYTIVKLGRLPRPGGLRKPQKQLFVEIQGRAPNSLSTVRLASRLLHRSTDLETFVKTLLKSQVFNKSNSCTLDVKGVFDNV
jgi:hypothetical protein